MAKSKRERLVEKFQTVAGGFKLPEGVKEAWVQALRSGRYKQGTGGLRNDEKKGSSAFCCLGVLAQEAGVLDKDGCYAGGVNSDFLNKGELDAPIPDDIQVFLAELNDNHKRFRTIADLIDEVL